MKKKIVIIIRILNKIKIKGEEEKNCENAEKEQHTNTLNCMHFPFDFFLLSNILDILD